MSLPRPLGSLLWAIVGRARAPMGGSEGKRVSEPMNDSHLPQSSSIEVEPTEQNPRYGVVCYYHVPISAAVRWVDDDGAHVVRSEEFDIYGEGDSLDDALRDFFAHADALFSQVADV